MNSALVALTCPFVLYLWFSGQLRVWYAAPALAALMTALVMAASVGGLLASSFAVLVFLVASRSLRALLQTLAALAVVASPFSPGAAASCRRCSRPGCWARSTAATSRRPAPSAIAGD